MAKIIKYKGDLYKRVDASRRMKLTPEERSKFDKQTQAAKKDLDTSKLTIDQYIKNCNYGFENEQEKEKFLRHWDEAYHVFIGIGLRMPRG